ncbi:hypothetical protein SDC9_37845 [bioreactor metagenome]|uniref:DUF6259 domain-containing protein n=1 Tax=bioreactor metagenome TaxID=1076179 RepID=A0A644VKB1_9ZZZZ|nr:DUF6259 domain-containing protein [Paludibacter sp.]
MIKKVLIIVVLLPVLVFGAVNNTPLISDDGTVVVLNNGTLQMSFKRGDKFNLYSIASLKNNQSWVTSSGMTNAIWILTVEDNNGIATTVNSSSAIVSYKGFTISDSLSVKATLNFTWTVALANNISFDVYVKVALDKNSALSTWEIEAGLPANYNITGLTFPRITFVRNSATKAVFPMGWGAEYDLRASKTYTCMYPSSSATVQMMTLNKGIEALYFATHDHQANIKNFNITTNETTGATLSVDAETSQSWTNGNRQFVLPWKTSIGVHPDGWVRAAKDWYKPFSYQADWGKQPIPSRVMPQWIKNTNFWVINNASDGVVELTTRVMNYFGAGQTASHAFYWHNYPFDTYYPEYFPAKSNFIDLKNYIQNAGSHVTPYINGRLWDSTTDFYRQQNAEASAVKNKDGSIFYDRYESINQAVMCPATSLWKNTLLDITRKLSGETQIDGIYYDQIASAKAVPCWNPNHGHALGGGDFWVKSYRKLIAELRAEGLNSNQIMTTEQNAECYVDLFDVMYMTNRPRYRTVDDVYQQVPLFQYIYSDRALLYGFNVYNVADVSLIFKNTLSLLWGGQIGAVQADLLMNSILVNHRNFIRTLANFRGQNPDVFLGGELMEEFIPTGDNPLMDIPDYWTSNVIRGARWQTVNGDEVSILVNFDSKAHTIVVNDQELVMDAYSCKRINAGSSGYVSVGFDHLNLVNDGYFINTGITDTIKGPFQTFPGKGYWYPHFSNNNQGSVYITPDSDRNNRNAAGIKITTANIGNWTRGLAQRLSAPDNGIYRVGFWAKIVSQEPAKNSSIRVYLRINDTSSIAWDKAGLYYFSRRDVNYVSRDEFLTTDWVHYNIEFDLSKKALKDSYTESLETTESDLRDFSLYFSNYVKTNGADILITGVTMTRVDHADMPSVWYNPGFETSYAVPNLLTTTSGNPIRAQETTTKGLWVLSLMDGISDASKSQATVVVDSTQSYSGKRSMRLHVKKVTDFSKVYLATTLFNLPKDDYIFSFYAKTNINQAPFRIDVDNYNIEKASAKVGFPFNDQATLKTNQVASTDWTKYEVEFNNTEMSDTLAMAIRPNITSSGFPETWSETEISYWFDDFAIMKKDFTSNKILSVDNQVKVVVTEKVVHVLNVKEPVEIVDLNGSILARKEPVENQVQFSVNNQGVYIVRSGGVNKKIIVR